MKLLGTQFHRLSGPDITSSYKIEFTVDEANRECLSQLLKLKKGTEVVLMMYITGEDDDEINDLSVETDTGTRQRLNRRMHAMINEIAASQHKTPEEIKIALKKYLISKKYIVKSSSELDIKGLAIAIYYLQTEFHN